MLSVAVHERERRTRQRATAHSTVTTVHSVTRRRLAYEATEDARYLERARATFENIQPLKDPRQGNYRSPYSAASAGARTEDYSTLSSQL